MATASNNLIHNNISFAKLKDDERSEINYIYHISDVHIRNTQRHTEYLEVFERTYKALRYHIGPNKTSIIVLTGDIMHTKTELSPESVHLAYHFLKNLSEIAPVILIPGNHDCNLSNKDRMDALTPIVDDVGEMENLYYLKKSGLYQYYNIVFGVTSIFDNMLVPASAISENIWTEIKQKNKYKIALYHGPVHGAKTDVGYRMNPTELLVEDFLGYDYVLLGDIHRHQYMDRTRKIAYAGSLIQQSYGETLEGHGILKWNLPNGESELIEIQNDYGYCTIKIVDGIMEKTKIPPKPRIRFVLENTNQLQYQDVLNKISRKRQICEIVKEPKLGPEKYHNILKKLPFLYDGQKLRMDTYVIQENIIRQYLVKQGFGEEKIKSVVSLHKNIYRKIYPIMNQAGISYDNGPRRWKILELRFSNMLSYGKNNIIDFRKYEPNRIIGIVAPNHYGKSAILDIILFCLFDRFSRGARRDILNKKKKKMYCSLLFSMGDQKYLIERIGLRNKNGLSTKIDVNFYSIITDKSGKEVYTNLNGLDKNDTNRRIMELVGNYDDYLATCFSMQHSKNTNFGDMTQLQKKEYLNYMLKLNVFEECYQLARDEFKKLSGELGILEKKMDGKILDHIKKDIKEATRRIRTLIKLRNMYYNQLEKTLDHILFDLSRTHLTKYYILADYKLETEEDIMNVFSKLKEKLSEKSVNIAEVKNRLKMLEEQQREIEQVMKREDDMAKKEGNTVNDLMVRKEKLLKKIVTVPRRILEKNVNEMIKNRKELEDRMNKMGKKSTDILSYEYLNSLKESIQKLQKSIQPIDSGLENLSFVLEKRNEHMEIFLNIASKIVESRGNFNMQECTKFSKKKYLELFLELNNIFKLLESYQPGLDRKNDLIVERVKILNRKLFDKYKKWFAKEKQMIEYKQNHNSNMIHELTWKILSVSLNEVKRLENDILDKKIKKMEKELMEYNEVKALQEKISLLDEQISEAKEFEDYMKKNNRIHKKIRSIVKRINIIKERRKMNKSYLEKLSKEISSCKNFIVEYQRKIGEKKKIMDQLRCLDLYYLEFLVWMQKNDAFMKWNRIKKNFLESLRNLEREIEKWNVELALRRRELRQYLFLRREFDQKSAESNIYQLYLQTMNYNGIPYEILKLYLPLIEADVNEILHSIVNFSIEFVFYSEEKDFRSNTGCVDIYICHQDTKSYNMQLASGFEKFIIGLALRIVFSRISMTPKPNFMIIDEGWSCLDTNNLNNIGNIMNYLRIQYEHVIIISHLADLKAQIDYTINIERINGYSHIYA
ncbi:MAG: metallophosphoesterase [Thermoplasmata archaeon]